jgi:hypothetical protein
MSGLKPGPISEAKGKCKSKSDRSGRCALRAPLQPSAERCFCLWRVMRPEAEASGYLEATTKAKASAKEEADPCGMTNKKWIARYEVHVRWDGRARWGYSMAGVYQGRGSMK